MLRGLSSREIEAALADLEGASFEAVLRAGGMKTTPMLDQVTEMGMRAIAGEKVVVSTPPQEGKSTRCSVALPVWAMIHHPGLRVAVASYGLDLSVGFSRRARALAQSLDGVEVKRGEGRAGEWAMANGSTYTSIGAGSAFTGRAVDLLVADDLVKGAQEARSTSQRDHLWEWWQSVALTRLAPRAGVLMIMTRWHKDDIASRVLDQGWPYLQIPAQATSVDDPLGRQPGEWLESVRGRTDAQWLATKQSMSNYFWQALYQGQPTASEGLILDPAKIVEVDLNPLLHKEGQVAWPTRDMRIVQSWDLAFTGSMTSDYVVGQVWGQLGDSYILLEQVRGHFSFTETLERVVNLHYKWPTCSAVLVEQAANGAAVIDRLSKSIHITPIKPRTSKELRALAVQPLVDGGHVKRGVGVVGKEWLDELADFPTSKHDDQVDAMTQALNYARPSSTIQLT